MTIKTVISVCRAKDMNVWKVAASAIVENIIAKQYHVIVPNDEVIEFKRITPNYYNILSEFEYLDSTSMRTKEALRGVSGWYKQQLIKLRALEFTSHGDVALIWDADTVPIKTLTFTGPDVVNVYRGDEFHAPYFETIKRVLALEKTNNYSFVAQCLPCKGSWFKAFCDHIEASHGMNWTEAIVRAIDFQKPLQFSEYETLGTFISSRFNDEINVLPNRWQRYGNGLIGGISNLKYAAPFLSACYDYVSFETWDKPFSRIPGYRFLKYFEGIS